MGSNSSCKQGECMKFQKNSNFSESAVIEVYNNKFFVKGAFNFNKQSTFKKLQIAANQLCLSSGIGIQYLTTVMKLLAFKHDNVIQAFSTLSKQNRIQFIDKICEINLDLMDSLYQFLILNEDRKRIIQQLKLCPLQSFQGIQLSGIKIEDRFDLTNKGIGLLRASKVAIIFMCGGASSRFFFQDKFLHPLQISDQQTTVLRILFQKLRQNYRSKSESQIIDLPIVLIGNQTNTDLIETYLMENNFFNFNKMSIYFTTVSSLPILNNNGKICLNFEFNYLRRPRGSAHCLEQILQPKALSVFHDKKIQYVHLIGTQNLAQSPGDPLFLGLTHMLKRKVAIKCTSPNDSLEKFDRLTNCKDGVRVIDSDSLQEINREELFESNIAMNSMIFSFDSLNELVQKFNRELQFAGLYRAFSINQNIYDFESKKPLVNQTCWAFQKDIKDTISCAEKPLILKVDRSEFIPIITPKNLYSIQQAIQAYTKSRIPKFYQFKNSIQSSKASTSQKQKVPNERMK